MKKYNSKNWKKTKRQRKKIKFLKGKLCMVSFNLSEEANEKLKILSKQLNMNKSETIRYVLRNLVKNG